MKSPGTSLIQTVNSERMSSYQADGWHGARQMWVNFFLISMILSQRTDEPPPQLREAKYFASPEVTGELLNPLAQQREEERNLPPLVQVMPEPDVELPSAPSGRPPFRKIAKSPGLSSFSLCSSQRA